MCLPCFTVNSEIFTGVLISRSFVKKYPRKKSKSLCPLMIKVNHTIVANFSVKSMSLNAIHEIKILAKISGSTVLVVFPFLVFYLWICVVFI